VLKKTYLYFPQSTSQFKYSTYGPPFFLQLCLISVYTGKVLRKLNSIPRSLVAKIVAREIGVRENVFREFFGVVVSKYVHHEYD